MESTFHNTPRYPGPLMPLEDFDNALYPLAKRLGEPSMPNLTAASKPGFRSLFARSSIAPKIQKPSTSRLSARLESAPIAAYPHPGTDITETICMSSFVDETPAPHAPTPRSTDTGSHRRSRITVPVTVITKDSESLSTMTRWDPLPLFEAYPEAIKHAYLPVPAKSIEDLLRTHHHDRYARLRQGMIQGAPAVGTHGSPPSTPDRVKTERSTAISKSDWAHKIFVLVKSGYILQYAAKGSYDRLPEKILPLKGDSAVFASDAIPGKPWVLQISRRSDGADTSAIDNHTSVFRKLSFRGSTAPKVVGSLLLTLYSADEMECWLMAIRKQIEFLGGLPCSMEAPLHIQTDDANLTSTPSSTERCLTVLDPQRMADYNPFGLSPPGYNRQGQHDDRPLSEDRGLGIVEQRTSFGPSFDARSSSTTAISEDQAQLDRLREDFSHSDSSSGRSVLSNSRGTSPASSPVRDSFSPSQVHTAAKDISTLPLNHHSLAKVALEHETKQRMKAELRRSADQQRSSSTSAQWHRDSDHPSLSLIASYAGQTPSSEHDSLVSASSISPISTGSPVSPVSPIPAIPSPTYASERRWFKDPHRPITSRSIDVNLPCDPADEISASIYKLLESPISSTSPSSDIRPPRSASVRRRSRRASSARPRGHSQSQSAPSSPPAVGSDPDASCCPKPLRITKRKSMSTFIPSGPPPLPPPDCPLPAIPQHRTSSSQSIWSEELRTAELRKQSWRVTREYHPLRVDVL